MCHGSDATSVRVVSCLRTWLSGATDEEIRQAEEKFEESKAAAETAMYTLLDNGVEQVSQLVALVEAQVEYFKQNASILENVLHQLYAK